MIRIDGGPSTPGPDGTPAAAPLSPDAPGPAGSAAPRRHRLVRALVAYGVFAFTVLQVVEPIMHGLRLPERVLRVVVLVLLAGFPLVLLGASLLGLSRSAPDRLRAAGGRRFWVLLSAAALLALAAAGALFFKRPRASEAPGDFVVLLLPLHAGNAEAEGDAQAMQGLLARAAERALGHARGISLRLGEETAVQTEAAARALGKEQGADLIAWGEVTVLRGEVLIEPFLTLARPWDVLREYRLEPPKPFYPKLDDPSALEKRREAADQIARVVALNAADGLATRQPDLALQLLDALGTTDASSDLIRIDVLGDLGRAAEVDDLVRSAAARHPDNFRFALSMARLLHFAGDPAAAAFFDRAEALAADANALRTMSNNASSELHDEARSERLLRAALEKKPGDPMAMLMLGHKLREGGRYEEGQALMLGVAHAQGLDPRVALQASNLLCCDRSDGAEGFALARRTVAAGTDDPNVVLGLSRLLLRGLGEEGDRALVAAAARRVAAEYPKHPHLRRNAGEALADAGFPEEALGHLRAAVALAPTDPDARLVLAEELLGSDEAESHAQLARALALGTFGSKDAQRAWTASWLLLAHGEVEKALALLSARRDLSSDLGLSFLRCRALAQLGRPEAAQAAAALDAFGPDDDDQGEAALFAFLCRRRSGDPAAAASLKERLRRPPGKASSWGQRDRTAAIGRRLLGQISQEELFKAEAVPFARLQRSSRCRVRFFEGEHLLGALPAGDLSRRSAAEARLREAVETRAPIWEYDLARLELHELGRDNRRQ